MHKQEEEFVSFMIEKNDSSLDINGDYQTQLSKQFYGIQIRQEKCLQIKNTPTHLQQKIIKKVLQNNHLKSNNTPILNNELQKVKVYCNQSISLLQQLQKLLSSSKPKKQSSISLTNNTKLNLKITERKLQSYQPRTCRHKLQYSSCEHFHHLTQTSYRSTLNTSIKSKETIEQTNIKPHGEISQFRFSYK